MLLGRDSRQKLQTYHYVCWGGGNPGDSAPGAGGERQQGNLHLKEVSVFWPSCLPLPSYGSNMEPDVEWGRVEQRGQTSSSLSLRDGWPRMMYAAIGSAFGTLKKPEISWSLC